MVYDNTISRRTPMDLARGGEPGISIHDNQPHGQLATDDFRYALFTDDGRGNGDFICGTDALHWARAVAHALDFTAAAGRQVLTSETGR